MANTTIPITKNGKKILEEELKRLKSIERPSVIAAISEARAHGDLSENAEYDAAKEKQAFIEGRIIEIESKLSFANVIDPLEMQKQAEGKVVFSATVVLVDNEDHSYTYQIVGEDESDIKQGKISFNSPVARAIIGKQAGDTVEVMAPRGTIEYEIAKVIYTE